MSGLQRLTMSHGGRMQAPMSNSPIATGLWRGFTGRCPNCGKGRVLHKYLKVLSPCEVCGHDNAQRRLSPRSEKLSLNGASAR